MKKGWEKRFDAMWFAPKGETTLMDWTGLIKDTRSWLFPSMGNSAENTERYLKESLANMIKSFIKSESQTSNPGGRLAKRKSNTKVSKSK